MNYLKFFYNLFLILFLSNKLVAQTCVRGKSNLMTTYSLKESLPITPKVNYFILRSRAELSLFFSINPMDVKNDDFFSEDDFRENYCFLSINNDPKKFITKIVSNQEKWDWVYYVYEKDTLYINQQTTFVNPLKVSGNKLTRFDCELVMIPKKKLPNLRYVNFFTSGVVNNTATLSINDFGTCKIPFTLDTNRIVINDSVMYKEIDKNIQALSNDDMNGRGMSKYDKIHGAVKASRFLISKLKQYGLKPYFNTYVDTFTVGEIGFVLRNETLIKQYDKGYNLIAKIDGNDSVLKNEIILLTAHYDHLGGNSYGEDSVYNGANDNASGVVSVLNIANQINKEKRNGRTIMVVLFSGEELGRWGSLVLAHELSLNDTRFKMYALINIEMVGVPMDNTPGRMYVTGSGLSNMVSKLNEYLDDKKFVTDSIVMLQHPYVFEHSDNYSFFNHGIYPNLVTHTLTSFNYENFDYYHTVHDEYKWINMPHLYLVNTELIKVIEKMSNTPTREIFRNPNAIYEYDSDK